MLISDERDEKIAAYIGNYDTRSNKEQETYALHMHRYILCIYMCVIYINFFLMFRNVFRLLY